VFGPALVIGVGMGVNMVAIASAATSGVPSHLAGLASGLLNTGRMVGGAIGLAALSTIAAHHTDHLTARGTGMAQALTSGYDRGLTVCAGIMLAGALLALLVPGAARPVGQPADGAVPTQAPARARAETAEAAQIAEVAEV
jgi:hypothetical protein